MSIRDTLGKIESKAMWVGINAREISHYVQRLTARRSFETMAEDKLSTAEQELLTALDLVRRAKADYAAKTVNDKVA